MGDKGETSVNSCGPRNPEWETSVGDKCKLMRPKARRVGDKAAQGTQSGRQVWETGVNSCGPRHPEWETGGDKCKLMRPKEPRVGDKCGRQVWETNVGDKCGRQVGDKCKLMRPKAPRVGDKGETSVNSCGPRHPEWETRGRQV